MRSRAATEAFREPAARGPFDQIPWPPVASGVGLGNTPRVTVDTVASERVPSARAADPRGVPERDGFARLLLLAALVLGLARFVRLGAWSLWLDEVLTLADSLHDEPFEQKNPLGYLVFRGYLTLVSGRPSEFELRFLPAIFGWAGIPLAYWAFAPFAGRRAAAVGALFLSLSSWHVYWSQTARFYTLASDLSLLGSGLVLRGLWWNSTARVGFGLLAAAAGCLTHLSCAFVLPPLMALPFLMRAVGIEIPGTRSRAGRVLLMVGVLGLVAASPKFLDAWREWLVVKGGRTPIHLVLTTGFFVTPLLGTAALVGGIFALRRRSPFDVLCVGVCVAVMAEAAAAALGGRVSAQYVFVLLPWITVLAALPCSDRLGFGRAFPPWAYAVVFALPALTTVGLYLSVRQGERPQWRSAYRFVYEERRADDLILGMEAPVGEYYLSPSATDLREQYQLTYLDRWRASVPEQWARFDRRTWFVVNYEQLEDWEYRERELFEEMLRKSCRLVATFPLVVESRDLSVHVFLRD